MEKTLRDIVSSCSCDLRQMPIEKIDRISMISEQVKELREKANCINARGTTYPSTIRLMNEAADTIESLSDKLKAANMERTKEYHNRGILSETLEWLNKRIGTKLKLEAKTNDEVYAYGHRKSIEAFQEVRTHIEIEIAEQNENRSADCGGWIPCEERLPEEYGDYLVAWKPLYMTKDQMIELVGRVVPHFYEIVEYDPDDDKKWIGDIKQAHGQYEIIAWQPLPEPYHEP